MTYSLSMSRFFLMMLALTLFAHDVAAQGRYTAAGPAQRHFQEGVRLQEVGDDRLRKSDRKGAFSKWKEAIEAFNEAREADPKYIDAYARLGLLYYSLEQPKKALPILEAGLKRARKSSELRFWYGQNLMRAGRTIDGVKALERVAGDTDRFPEVYLVLGNYYYGVKDYKKAEPAYAQYVKVNPDATGARAKLGNAYFKNGAYQMALAEFTVVRRDWPKNVLVQVNIGNAHFQLKQFERAITELKTALEREPNRPSALFNLAQSYFQLKKYASATEQYGLFLKLRPKSFNGHYFQGSALMMQTGQDDAALKALQTAHELKPKIAQPLYKMGVIHLRNKRSEPAKTALTKALALAKNDPWVITALGTVARQQKNYDDAAKLQERAIKLAPEKARLHANLANTLLRAGRLEPAEKEAKEALELDAGDPWIKAVSASVLAAYAKTLAKSDPAKAESRLDKALALKPGDSALIASRALVRLAQGKTEAAKADADTALKADPKSSAAHYAKGRAFLVAGDPKNALTHLLKADQLRSTATTVAAVAAAELLSGDADAAGARYDAAIKTYPKDKIIAAGRSTALFHRLASKVNRGGYTGADQRRLNTALKNAEALDPLSVARMRYAAVIISLRKGDAKSARTHLAKMNTAVAQARKAEIKGSHLTDKVPPGHTDFLTAYINVLLKNYTRAEELLSRLRASKKPKTHEARLIRQVQDQLGIKRFKKGDAKGAEKLFNAAQKLQNKPTTAHNLGMVYWVRGKKKKAESIWKSLQKKVPESIFNMAVIHESRGEHREAYKAYKKYVKKGGPNTKIAKEAIDVKQRIFGFGEGGQ